MELRLARDCCRWNFRGARRDPVDTIGVNWPQFVRLARFHRIQGLVWTCLAASRAEVPEREAELLAEDARAVAAANLGAIAEARELVELFDQAGAPLLILKGAPLAKLAYGTSLTKSAVDIDLLIDPERLAEAATLVRARGYRPARSNLSSQPESLRRWHRFRKDSEWRAAATSLQIDFHTRLTDNPILLEGIGVHSPRQTVQVLPGIELPTLALDEMFAHLAVHGASSAWFRLKWISDFAALLAPLPPSEIERLFLRAWELGAGRAAGQALLLADRLFGSLDGLRDLRAGLMKDRSTRRLYRAALRQIAGANPREPTSRPWGTVRIHWVQLLLMPGVGFMIGELVRQGRAALASRR